MHWLVLQALVEVNGSGVGTGLSYPLLQFYFQPAHTHRATKEMDKHNLNAGTGDLTFHVQV